MAKNIKYFILLCILSVWGMNLQAQTNKVDTTFNKIKSFTFTDVQKFTDGFRFGIHLSPTIGSFTAVDTLDSEGAKTRLSLGIILDKYLGPQQRYAFSTGLSIMNKGGKLQTLGDVQLESVEQSLGFGREIDLKIRYWEIPLLLRMRTNTIQEKFVGYGHFGWVTGFRGKARGDVAGIEGANDIKFNKDVKFFNFSLSYGFGVEYKLGEESTAMVGLAFNTGLMNAMKNVERADVNHVALQIGIFY